MANPAPRPTLYDILGVDATANAADIRSAWKAAVVRNHPDTGGTAASFRAVQSAFDTLSDPDLRVAYDRELEGEHLGRGGGYSAYQPDGDPEPTPRAQAAPRATPRSAPQTAPRPAREAAPVEDAVVAPKRSGLSTIIRNGPVAVVLFVLLWVSVILRAKGLVPLANPGGQHVFGGIYHITGAPSVPSLTPFVLLVGLVYCLILAAGLNWLWRPMGWPARVGVLVAIEVLALSIVQLAVGATWAWVVAGVVVAGVVAGRILSSRVASRSGAPKRLNTVLTSDAKAA